MKKLSLFVLLSAFLASATAVQPQVEIRIDKGVIGVKIAVPEFQPAANDPKTTALTATFNKVLWEDLDYSGGLTLVSRSLDPRGKFSGPGDIKPPDWITPAVDAQFIAFGNIRAGNGSLSVE